MNNVICRINNLSGENSTVTAEKGGLFGGYSKYTISLPDWSQIESIDFGYSLFDANAGDEG